MLRTVALSLAAVHLSTTMAQDCAAFEEKEACKGTKGCKWSKGRAVCYLASGTPAPTSEPTEPPTDAPTATPTEPPTDSPTAPPTKAPTTEVKGPFEQADCDAIDTKSQCNRTPTCVYQNLNEACVGCPNVASRNSCENTIGCAWRQKGCMADDSEPHPDDDKCGVHNTKRHCRRTDGCQWNRNGTCSGSRGCAAQKNNIDCRAASKCYWLPNERVCVDAETVEQP